jgi:hypothetical protein
MRPLRLSKSLLSSFETFVSFVVKSSHHEEHGAHEVSIIRCANTEIGSVEHLRGTYS